MLKRILTCSLFLFPALCAVSQVFHGRILSESGEPLPHATVYIREIHSGFVADANGSFRTTIRPGDYTCEVSFLGYSKQLIAISVPQEGLRRDITLAEQAFRLPEVSISGSRENPAYPVMRKAIANAPAHRYRVKKYSADTYLKGSGKLTAVPGILMLSGDFRKEVAGHMNKTFLLEEQRKVVYTAPDNWDNEIIARSNTFPEEIEVGIETTDINLYTPKLFGKVSPLSAGAFSYYNFVLDGCYSEGEYLINKVRVIPKKDNPDLLSGHLYIIEDLWSLSGIDLEMSGMGITAGVKVVCNEVQPSLFLTTSISMKTTINVFGIKAQAVYLSSIKYTDIEQSATTLFLAAADSAGVHPASGFAPEQQKAAGIIGELAAKDELTTAEAYRLSRMMTKRIQKADTTRAKHKYEIKARNYQSRVDSLAESRDSLYWEGVRSVPLSEEELAGYTRKRMAAADTGAGHDGKGGKNGFVKDVLQLFMEGKTYRTRDKKAWLTLRDVRSMLPEYNFVDGFWIGAKVEAGIRFSDASSLTLTPQAHYTTARHEWVSAGTLALEYAPRYLGRLQVSGGSRSADFNGDGGESRFINSYASLLFGRSDIKFYNSRYFSVGNRIEIANSLLFTSALGWERRSLLENNDSRSLFGKRAKPNIPDNPGYVPVPKSELLKMSFSLTYTPAHYYRMIRGKKVYRDSSFPTFGVLYEQAFDHGGAGKVTPSYKKVELSVNQKIEFGLFNNLFWKLNGGMLIDTEDMHFTDYRHFETTRLPVTVHSMSEGFSRAGNYSMSTDTRWAQANIMWRTPYLLIKQLPFLRKKRFDEALHLRSLVAFRQDVYSELGYSIGLLDAGRVGVFAGFDRLKCNSVGVSVSLPVLGIFGK